MAKTYDYRLVLGPHSPMSMPLQRLLASNRTALHGVGTEFPQVKAHRDVMTRTLGLLKDGLAEDIAHQNYVETVLESEDTSCIIYAYDAFFSSRESAFRSGSLYPRMEKKLAPLRRLTDGQQVTVFLCLQHFTQFVEVELIRNPHLPHLVGSFPHNVDFSWVDFILRMKEAWPEALLVIVGADDLAVNWAKTVALITGHLDTHNFVNIEEFPLSSLAADGRAPYLEALSASPPSTVPSWTEVTSRFFAEYGHHVPIVRKVVVSPWSDAQIEHSKQKYDADLANLKGLDNVIMASDVVWDDQ